MLIYCPCCDAPVSMIAHACPCCGQPQPGKRERQTAPWVWWGLAALMGIGIINSDPPASFQTHWLAYALYLFFVVKAFSYTEPEEPFYVLEEDRPNKRPNKKHEPTLKNKWVYESMASSEHNMEPLRGDGRLPFRK